MKRIPPKKALLVLVVLVFVAAWGGLMAGASVLGFADIPVLLGWSEPAPGAWNPTIVFWELRLPRVLTGLLVGAALSLSGAMMQGLFRNPLADPGLIGVSSGAALGAVAAIVLSGPLGGVALARLLPGAALVGAWVATGIILRAGSRHGSASVATLLLAGIAINAFAGAFIGLCMFLATDTQLRSLNFWMLGSLGGASWESVALLAPFCVLLFLGAPRMARGLNAFSLGEAEAGHLGCNPETVKRWVIALTAIGVGGCVAQTGMIGFVGLVVPHLFRITVGPDHRWLLPGSALLGAALLVMADTLSRTVAAPAEIPIGIVTAAVGAPFFLALLWRQKRKFDWL